MCLCVFELREVESSRSHLQNILESLEERDLLEERNFTLPTLQPELEQKATIPNRV